MEVKGKAPSAVNKNKTTLKKQGLEATEKLLLGWKRRSGRENLCSTRTHKSVFYVLFAGEQRAFSHRWVFSR